jgi:hypothetical protein
MKVLLILVMSLSMKYMGIALVVVPLVKIYLLTLSLTCQLGTAFKRMAGTAGFALCSFYHKQHEHTRTELDSSVRGGKPWKFHPDSPGINYPEIVLQMGIHRFTFLIWRTAENDGLPVIFLLQ